MATARTLNTAHRRWEMHTAIYENEKRPKGVYSRSSTRSLPRRLVVRSLRDCRSRPTARNRCTIYLGLSSPAPQSFLIEVGDGEVRVAVEPERAEHLRPSGRPLNEAEIDDAVTRYSDGRWWVHGRFGPYKTREAGVARLRNL